MKKSAPATSDPAVLLNSVSHGLVTTDHRGLVSKANGPALALLGASRLRIKGTPILRLLNLLDPVTRSPLPVFLPRSFIRNRGARRHHLALLVAVDGKEHLVDATFTPLIDMWSKITGLLVVLLDIAPTAAIHRAQSNRDILNALGNLASHVARDFGHWLNVVAGHATTIAENLIPDTRAHDETAELLKATRRAGDIVRRLLSIGIVGEATPHPPAEKANLDQVVTEAISMAQGMTAGVSVSFNLRNIALMRPVQANPDRLMDCLVHVLQYCLGSMPNGGAITLSASRTLKTRKPTITLIIHHDGKLISKEEILHVFDPFFSSRKAHSIDGLGLTITKAAVERWGGRIAVQSRPRHGTTFRITLPMVKESSIRSATGASTRGETILLVDDKDDCLEEALVWLEDAGYRVISARTGEECIRLFHRHAADIQLSIIDVMMPGTNGNHVLHDILTIDPTAPLLLTSGFSRDYLRSYIPHGAWGYLQKPFESPHFLSTVRRYLDQKEQQAKPSNA